MAVSPLISDGPAERLLLVEGPDEYHLLGHLQTYHNLQGQFRRTSGDGIKHIISTLPTRLKLGNEERLGIIVDADADIGSCWASVCGALKQAGYTNLPQKPNPSGTIMQQDEKPTVGLWIMPDNILPGTLEDFVRLMLPDSDKLWDRAVQAVQEIPETERLFPPQHQMKANIHTWLAWQEEPGTAMGQAITKRYLQADAPQAQTLVAWLRKLFLE